MSVNNNNAAQQEAPANGGIANAILRGMIMYMAMNAFKTYTSGGGGGGGGPAATSTTSTATSKPIETDGNPSSGDKMKPRGALDLSYPGMKAVKRQPRCLWGLESIFDLHIYITDDQNYPLDHCDPASIYDNKDNEVLSEWHESDLVFGGQQSSTGGNSNQLQQLIKVENKNQRNANLTIPLTEKVQFNQTHI